VKESVFEIEGIGQTVGGVDAHHQRSLALRGEVDCRGCGDARLADAAFAAEK
jgi:hypothetical protein